MASRHFYCQTFSLLIFFHKKRKGIEGRLWSDKKRENQGTNNQSCKHTWWEILATTNAYDVQHYKNVRMYYKEHVYIHRGNVLSSTTCTQQSEIFATLQRWKLLEKILFWLLLHAYSIHIGTYLCVSNEYLYCVQYTDEGKSK